jgi:hypothetical protein
LQIHKPFFRLLGVKNDFTVSYSPDIFYSVQMAHHLSEGYHYITVVWLSRHVNYGQY